MSQILITGATGFIGSQLIKRLLSSDDSQRLVAVVRQSGWHWPERVTPHVVTQMESVESWVTAMENISVIVHCAARAHIMRDSAINPLEQFRRVNVFGTLNLARQAASVGVKRFIFISSIGVNGAETFTDSFTAQDLPAPHSDYSLSKYEAELGLQKIANETGMEVVIIRPPLVYGAGAPGNFGVLLSWLSRGVPLPLGAIYNKRSFVALDNLIDLIVTCISHPAAANQIFLVSDNEDVSTTELLRRMGIAMGKPIFLVPIPEPWLRYIAVVLRKPDVAQRLCGSLRVDIKKTCQLLDWIPPLTLDEGLKKAVGSNEG